MRLKQQERQARNHIPQWKRSIMYSLDDAYKSCSIRKKIAWRHCEYLCAVFNGWNLCVISKNTNIFTAGFQFIGAETGIMKFMYITPLYEVVVNMEEE